MIVRIGTMFMGEVDAVGPHSIKTKFFVLGVPLIPLGSTFFTGPSSGVPIPIHGKSVVAGYLRLGLGLATLISGVFAFMTPSYRRGVGDFVTPALWFMGFIASFMILGRLSNAEKERRRILRARTGLAANPAILPPELRHQLETELRTRLEEKELPLRPDAWLSHATASSGAGPYREAGAPAIDAATWADVYAYARYASVSDRGWKSALEPLWKKVAA